jgi:hypothetical protein
MFQSACDMNTKIEHLYLSHIEKIMDMINSDNDLSDPLLIKVDEKYLHESNKVKIMIVGQETYNCWELQGLTLPFQCTPQYYTKELMNKYADFHWNKCAKSSPFWRASDMIYEMLNNSSDRPNIGYIWNNIDKLDYKGGQLTLRYRDLLHQQFNVFAEEVRLLNPDVVIMFIGNDRYDGYLRSQGANFIPIEHIQDDNILARIVWDKVLPERSYITYHPNYLYRSGNKAVLDEIVRLCMK